MVRSILRSITNVTGSMMVGPKKSRSLNYEP
jgi:hypothetical protein